MNLLSVGLIELKLRHDLLCFTSYPGKKLLHLSIPSVGLSYRETEVGQRFCQGLSQLSPDLLCSEIVSALKLWRFVPLSLAPHKDFSCVYHENSWCSN